MTTGTGGTSDTTLDDLPDGVVRVDADRRIVEANGAALALTGYPRGDLVGRPIAEVLDPRGRDGKPLLHDDWHASARLPSVRLIPEQQVEIRCADDGTAKLMVTGRYIRNGNGALAGAVLVLRPSARRVHLAAQGIEVVSTVSHELRSPLTSVKGYTSLLLNRWDRLKDEQKRMMLEQVNYDADRVTRLITELLDISRLETGRLVLRRQLVDVAAVAQSVVDKVRMAYPELDADLAFAENLPRVYADPDKLEQVLTNLVENAAKYATPVGLRITGGVEGDDAVVSVHDRGPGIPGNLLEHLFEKFFRAPDTKPTGSGLGLWISRGLVEAHGGRLDATSVPGEGSTFRFTLPLGAFEELHK
jgi:PAS domain S-box-containing protein